MNLKAIKTKTQENITTVIKSMVNENVTVQVNYDFEKEIDIPLLYKKMLVEFDRILKDEGKLCILTGAKNHFEQAVKENKTFSKNSQNPDFKTDVLVNGKKASIYLLKK